MKDKRVRYLLILILVLGSVVRLFHLDRLPGEIYGDISINIEYLERISQLGWPHNFVLSAGPFYYYAVFPIIFFLGNNYLALKIGSSIFGILTIFFTFLLSRKLANLQIALIASLFTAISFWVLIFSRLGNIQIIIPLIIILSYYFLILWLERISDKKDGSSYLFLSLIFACFGLYTMPQSFILLPLIILTILFYLFFWRKKIENAQEIILKTLLLSFILSIPFIFLVYSDLANFTHGYIGGKLGLHQDVTATLSQSLINLKRALMMFNIKGDMVFRSNISKAPHLDFVSGLLLILGIIIWFWKNRQMAIMFGLLPVFVLLLPSVLVLGRPQEVPSASRAIGVTPFIYLLIAYGFSGLYGFLKPKISKHIAVFILTVIFCQITLANMQNYFIKYAYGLPNHNLAFDRIIANWIVKLPSQTKVYLTSCCWGDWGQPEPKGVYYSLDIQDRGRYYFTPQLNCMNFQSTSPYVIILDPKDRIRINSLYECLHKYVHTYKAGNTDVFSYISSSY
ncbi:glycosyltransferase family 39 protein [Patescibacteria group bacterium]|nr:glycosyltransferase family 39 protein [Patescibacteria group bacterium]MCL5798462.1 glycosyltransferase family 39 protein [Patescibacteria group bacterium]